MKTSETNLPLNIGTASEFARLRAAFKAAQFDEETVLSTLAIMDMSDIGTIDFAQVDFSRLPEQFEALVYLFLVLRPMPSSRLERLFEPETLEAFLSLGLLGTGDLGPSEYYAKVLLYPLKGFWIASDRYSNPDGSPFVAPPDIVFPAIYSGTLRFLKLLPLSDAEHGLDLCAGSGIGAFLLSRCSKRAVSSDLTERATHFAAFNRSLNDLTNVEVVRGDLFEPVAGQTFDRIVAHPPYVPSLTNARIWRDGGKTGEQLIRRIVSELRHYLRRGGIFCGFSLGLDTREGQFEERVRGWLEDAGEKFDIIFASTDDTKTPSQVLRTLAEREDGIGPEEEKKLRAAFAEAGIVRMPKGALVIRRHGQADQHQAWTVRTKLSEVTEGSDFENTLASHHLFSEESFVNTLLKARPVPAPRLEVKVTHVVHEGELAPAQFVFEIDKPFNLSVLMDGWVVPLIARFDGKETPLDIYEQARASGDIPDGFQLNNFVTLLARMIERGFLIVPEA